MYLSPSFAETEISELHRLIQAYPFGALVTHSPQGLDANHIPFELDAKRGEYGTLVAHIARANPLWSDLIRDAEVMAIFQGAQGYISPNWYPSKHETHRQVPTWNYEVVHAHGRLRVIEDEKSLRAIVGRLTQRHEATQVRPWKMADAPRDYLEQMLKMIVGIEVEVTRLEGKRKLGQNREMRDREGAIHALQERGSLALSSAMERSKSAKLPAQE